MHGGGQRQLRSQQRGVRQSGAVHIGDVDLRPGLFGATPVGGQFPGGIESGATLVSRDDLPQRPRGRRVVLLDVVGDHPGGQHLGPQGLQRVPHHLDPARWRPVLVALVELGRHRLLQQLVEGGGLQVVAPVLVGHAVRRRDLPAVLAVVPLVPPAVSDGEVQPAVQRALHPRRSAGLQRPQRVVQPDVAAPVEQPRHRHVVIGQEGDPVPHLGAVGEPHHLLDQRLAAVVGGVRLTGDDRLHRPLLIEQQPFQPSRVAQHQGQPLVRRNPPGEPHGEHIGIECC